MAEGQEEANGDNLEMSVSIFWTIYGMLSVHIRITSMSKTVWTKIKIVDTQEISQSRND